MGIMVYDLHGQGQMGVDVGGWGLGVGLHSTVPTIVGASFFRNLFERSDSTQPSNLNPQPSVQFLFNRNLVQPKKPKIEIWSVHFCCCLVTKVETPSDTSYTLPFDICHKVTPPSPP